jgi:hypothetical protein
MTCMSEISSTATGTANDAAWRALEPELRKILASSGISKHGSEWVIADLKARSLPIGHGSATNWNQISEHLAERPHEMNCASTDIMGEWFTALVLIAIDLYRAKFRELPRVIEGGKA